MLAGILFNFYLKNLAKSIELDERIPFISKLRRFTYLPYGTSDFRKCEC